MMKKMKFAVLLVMFLYGIPMWSFTRGEEVINMQHIGNHGNHSEYYPPADMPEVYYNSDNQEIIIVADGFSSYYDVDIVSESTLMIVISTQVDGYGDSIDISSLPDDNYTIVITSEYNNVFEGQFTNY